MRRKMGMFLVALSLCSLNVAAAAPIVFDISTDTLENSTIFSSATLDRMLVGSESDSDFFGGYVGASLSDTYIGAYAHVDTFADLTGARLSAYANISNISNGSYFNYQRWAESTANMNLYFTAADYSEVALRVDIGIFSILSSEPGDYSAGWEVDLFDLTAGEILLVAYDDILPGTGLVVDATLPVTTGHRYRLSANAETRAAAIINAYYQDRSGDGSAQTFFDVSLTSVDEPPAPAPVPEPSTMLLLGSGLAGLVGYGRARIRK